MRSRLAVITAATTVPLVNPERSEKMGLPMIRHLLSQMSVLVPALLISIASAFRTRAALQPW
jgi:hypothetical protein